MKIAIPKEVTSGEKRVALVPQLVSELTELGCSILIEKNAGINAHFTDENYQNVQFYAEAATLYQDADVVLKINPPTEAEIAQFKRNTILISFLFPFRHAERTIALRQAEITSFALEAIPRISRAQSMDVLSSQATIAGYKSVLIAANLFDRFFPMLTTAAGTIRPTRVLVIGAGVAGLQAIATARRLGAIVKAYDIRSSTKEQVESLGAKMIETNIKADSVGGYARELAGDEQQKQQMALLEAFAQTDVVISTAAIPGKQAPKIIMKPMVERMPAGGIIIDAVAESGGNCELTQPDQKILHNQITIYGPCNLPSLMARDASTMFAKNIVNFLKLFIKDSKIMIDWLDPILAESVITHEGKIKHQITRDFIEGTSHGQ